MRFYFSLQVQLENRARMEVLVPQVKQVQLDSLDPVVHQDQGVHQASLVHQAQQVNRDKEVQQDNKVIAINKL